MKQKDKRKQKQLETTMQFMDLTAIGRESITTTEGDTVAFVLVSPVNLSVLGESVVAERISALANVLTSTPELQLLAYNASQSYEANKAYLTERMQTEKNETVADLDRRDIEYLDDIRITMATGREFALALRFRRSTNAAQQDQILKRLLMILSESGFTVRLAGEQDLKRVLAIYYAQDIYNDTWADHDGEDLMSPAEAKKELSFIETIAPSVIDFRKQTSFVCGNTYRCVWAVRGYPTTTKDQAIFRELGERDGVTLHIYTRSVSSYEINKILDKAERKNMHALNNSKRMKEQVEAKTNIEEVQHLIETMHKNKEPFLHCAVFIEMQASGEKELDILRGDVAAILNRHKILCDKLYLQQRDGMQSSQPAGQNAFGRQFERVLPASSVANMFPFSYSGKTDPHGMYIGRDANGSNIIVDLDQRAADKTNGHAICFGGSGQGKSYLLKMLVCNIRQSGKRVYINDPENEYKELVENLGGTYMDMVSGKYIINPLEPRIWSQTSGETPIVPGEPAAFRSPLRIRQHIAFLRDFFQSYKEFPAEQLDTLEIMLAMLYRKFNLTEDTDYSKLWSIHYPTLADLYKLLTTALERYDEAAAAGTVLYSKDTLRGLTLAMHGICVGAESAYFNGHTNIPNSDFIDFGVKDMFATNQNLMNAMYFNIFSFMSNQYLTAGDTSIFFDELQELLKNKIALSYLGSFVARGRKRGSNVIMASPAVSEFFRPEIAEQTKPLMTLPTHRFLFHPGNVNTDEFKANLALTDPEYAVIQNPNRGHCLYTCGNERYHLNVIAPKHKKVLFGTAGGK